MQDPQQDNSAVALPHNQTPQPILQTQPHQILSLIPMVMLWLMALASAINALIPLIHRQLKLPQVSSTMTNISLPNSTHNITTILTRTTRPERMFPANIITSW